MSYNVLKIHYLKGFTRCGQASALLALGMAVVSCAPMSNEHAQGAGAVAGALGGAALGGIVGNQSGRAGEGALVGATAGGLLGAQNGQQWFGGSGNVQKTERE